MKITNIPNTIRKVFFFNAKRTFIQVLNDILSTYEVTKLSDPNDTDHRLWTHLIT